MIGVGKCEIESISLRLEGSTDGMRRLRGLGWLDVKDGQRIRMAPTTWTASLALFLVLVLVYLVLADLG